MSTLLRSRLGNVSVVLTRWVLVIAISYAVILSADGTVPLWPHQVFIAFILGSNLVLAWILSRGKSWRMLSGWATGLDIAAVSMAISVAGNISAEFYMVYFSVLILSAVVDRRGFLIALALIACASYAILLWAEVGDSAWRSSALLVRLPVLFGVALYFGTAVQAARREYQRQQEQLTIERGKALSALTEMGNIALSGGYPGPVLYEVAAWVQEIAEFDRCSLLVFGSGGEEGYLAASGDDAHIEVLALEMANYPELGPVLRRGEFTEIHPNRPADLWEQVQSNLPEGSPFSSFIVMPIKRADHVIGAFYLRDSDPERTLREAQRDFCSQAARMAAAFIHEHDLLAQLEERSKKDTLSGLLNYDVFLSKADLLISGAEGSTSLAVVNIDNLRDINTKLGHKAGNFVIGRVGQQLLSALPEALVCRYGGDEFIALVEGPGTNAQNLLQLGFLNLLDEARGDLEARVAASVGVATTPDDGDNAEALLQAARQAMREAKAAGGHRIRITATF